MKTRRAKSGPPFSVRIEPAHHELVRQAAAFEMMTPSAWARRTLVRAAQNALHAHAMANEARGENKRTARRVKG